MSEKEKLMYYFLHCQDKEVDSKIKELTETNEVVQMVDKRVDQIEEDRWKKLSEEFARLHENEREMRIKKYGERKMKEAEEKGTEVKGIVITVLANNCTAAVYKALSTSDLKA